jgi:hypothetical protein
LPRFAKKWDITWHDVSNKNDDFCRLEIGNLTLFIQEQWWVLLVWISQHWKFTPMLWPYSTDKAYYDKHNTTKRVGQQPMGASNNNIYIYTYIPKIKYRLLYIYIQNMCIYIYANKPWSSTTRYHKNKQPLGHLSASPGLQRTPGPGANSLKQTD